MSDELRTPATEPQIGEVLTALSPFPGLSLTVRRLAFERDQLRDACAAKTGRVEELANICEQKETEAARYRWLRQHPVGVLEVEWGPYLLKEALDAEIDRQLKLPTVASFLAIDRNIPDDFREAMQRAADDGQD